MQPGTWKPPVDTGIPALINVGSDVNGARKLAGLNANQADGAMATNDAVRRYFISTNVSS